MKAIKFIHLLLLFPLLFICAKLKWKVPENYVALNEKVAICKYELTVLEYKKYLLQMKLDSSAEFYASQQPDSVSLQYLERANDYYCNAYYTGYFSYPGYHLFPMIGVSYDQVINFCRWKNSTQKEFTYRLPTPEEWDLAYGNNKLRIISKQKNKGNWYFYNKTIRDSLGISESSKVYAIDYNVSDLGLLIYKDSIYKYHKPEHILYEGPAPQPCSIYDMVENERGLTNVASNVSEMTSVRGIAKGANFLLPYNFSKAQIEYTKPEAWLGVRLVAERKR